MSYEFGDILVNEEKMTLEKSGKVVDCEPRVFQLLLCFCQRPQEAISREQLIADVWQGRVVSDAAVNRAVAELRKLIEDDSRKPVWITTVSKVGYRLNAEPIIVNDGEKGEGSPHVDLHSTQTIKPKINRLPIKPVILIVCGFLFAFVAFALYIERTESNALNIQERKPLTSSLGIAFNPYYHDESKVFAYLYRDERQPFAQIKRQNYGEEASQLTLDNYYYTDVVIKDRDTAYASRLNDLNERICSIVEIELESAIVSEILPCGKDSMTQLVFDRHRNQLIYQQRESVSNPYAIYSFQLNSGRKTQLTHPAQTGNGLGDYIFALAPDNENLAVIEYGDAASDQLKVIALDNSQTIQSFDFIKQVYGLLWFDNNTLLVSNESGLYQFSTENGLIENVEKSDQFYRLAKGAGRSILTERSHTSTRIISYSLKGGEQEVKTQNNGINSHPVYANNTDSLVFLSDMSGEKQLYLSASSNQIKLLKFSENIGEKIDFVSALSWSANDEFIAASINDKLFLYHVKSAQWKQLATDFKQIHHASFYQDDMLLFSAESDGQWQIWQYDKPSGNITQLTTSEGYSAYRDGAELYFTKYSRDGLYAMDLETKEERTITNNFPVRYWRHWQINEGNIAVLTPNGYMRVDAKTGAMDAIKVFSDSDPSQCSMSLPQNRVVCSELGQSTSNIWQIELSH